MSKSDREMEDNEKLPRELGDTEKLPSKLGDNVQESQSKILVSEVESKGETFSSEAADQGNSNKNENGGQPLGECTNAALNKSTIDSEVEDQIHPHSEPVEPKGIVEKYGEQDLKKCTNASIDKITIDSEVENQIHPNSEAVEPASVTEPVGEPINDKSENVDLIPTKTKGEKQIEAGCAVEKHTGTENDHVKQSTTNGGLKEAQPEDGSLESGDHVKIVEEKPSADVVDKMPEKSNKVGGYSVEHVAEEETARVSGDAGNDPMDKNQLPTDVPENKEMEDAAILNVEKEVNDEQTVQGKEMLVASPVSDRKADMVETSTKHGSDDSSHPNQHEPATPNSVVRYSPSKDGDHSGQTAKTVYTQATLPPMAEGDDGTAEDQAAFMKEIESFYRARSMDFKPPKFYGQPLNCLKLWRSVIRLGGYDRVTGSKLWRQVGESFHPPKTCTTVSWTFRIFYEKSLLEFERHKKQCGELELPLATLPDSGVENEGNGHQGPGSGSGRARRDSATRAMQGWHVQRVFDNGEVGEPIIKDKNPNNTGKREKNLKSIGSIKQKRPNEMENSIKIARTETHKQLVTSVVDVGPPADWVKINIRQTPDCFEVYALVPGLLREEVRVQSDPAGRLVITGHPEQVDNPWGITPFKKVVSLPARIDPLQTSAVVSLHGRLFVRVPFEQSTNT